MIPRTKQRIPKPDKSHRGTGRSKANNTDYVNRDVNSILAFFDRITGNPLADRTGRKPLHPCGCRVLLNLISHCRFNYVKSYQRAKLRHDVLKGVPMPKITIICFWSLILSV